MNEGGCEGLMEEVDYRDASARHKNTFFSLVSFQFMEEMRISFCQQEKKGNFIEI